MMIGCEKEGGSGEHIDRISDLPSNVIDIILQHLPIHDLVKTSILSRKWRNMWTSVSRLFFENIFFEKCKNLEYLLTSSIITEVLFLQNGPIQEFSVHIPSYYPIKMECLNTWILFVSRKRVKEIYLVNEQTNPYQLPSHILSCQELTFLDLYRFKLSTAPNFRGFKSLVELHLTYIVFEPGTLESLVSGCPLIVHLTIRYCSGFGHIDVSSPFVKNINIEACEVIKSICLKQAQNLTDLTLKARRSGDNIEGGWVSVLIKGLSKIGRLCLGRGYVKNLSAGINPQVLLSSVDTLKYLELFVNFNNAEELLLILSLLQSSPNLEELVIKCHSKAVGPQMILKEFDYNNCCISQLKIVNIIVGIAYEHALNLIQFVLSKSPSLEILTLKVDHLGLKESDASILFCISRDLLQMDHQEQKLKSFLSSGVFDFGLQLVQVILLF